MENKVEKAILKIDLDCHINVFLERMWLMKYLGLDVEKIEVYKTNQGYHLYIYTLNTLNKLEILLFEQILGDDNRRAAYNYLRIKSNAVNFDPLYCRKYKLNKLGEIEQVSEEKYLPELTEKITEFYLSEISEKLTILATGGVIHE
ncbi:MAG: hypothetical protein ACTSQE_08195 [Candidatus Heimdallarchaeaceae archaeon]